MTHILNAGLAACMPDQAKEWHHDDGSDEGAHELEKYISQKLCGMDCEHLDRVHDHTGAYGVLVECPAGKQREPALSPGWGR